MSAFDPAYTEMSTAFCDLGVTTGSDAEVVLTKTAGMRWMLYGIQFAIAPRQQVALL